MILRWNHCGKELHREHHDSNDGDFPRAQEEVVIDDVSYEIIGLSWELEFGVMTRIIHIWVPVVEKADPYAPGSPPCGLPTLKDVIERKI